MESSKVRAYPDEDLLASSDSEDEVDNFLPNTIVTNDSAELNTHFCEPYFNSTMGGRDLRV